MAGEWKKSQGQQVGTVHGERACLQQAVMQHALLHH